MGKTRIRWVFTAEIETEVEADSKEDTNRLYEKLRKESEAEMEELIKDEIIAPDYGYVNVFNQHLECWFEDGK